MRTIVYRAIEASDKARSLLNSISTHSLDSATYIVSLSTFSKIPNCPFSYWASPSMRSAFARMQSFESNGRIARKGLTTSDDPRYVRLWWEIDSRRKECWAAYAKGGSSRKFFSDRSTVVLWNWDLRTIPGYVGRPGRETAIVECADLMGGPGLTWPLRASAFSPSVLPTGSVFSARGYTIQAQKSELEFILAVCSSYIFDQVFKLCLGRSDFPEFIVGVLQKLPFPDADPEIKEKLSGFARRAWSLNRRLAESVETSHSFVLPAVLLQKKSSNYNKDLIEAEVRRIQAAIDDEAFLLYNLSAADCAAPGGDSRLDGRPDETQTEDDTDDVDFVTDDVEAVLSWCVGVAFGRFDPRLAVTETIPPFEPCPFDPLPERSPAMIPEGGELLRSAVEILTDDSGVADDLATMVGDVLDYAGLPQEGALAPTAVRAWLARTFWPIHIKTYSKSRRKAPIYWQLSTPSNSYSVWLYIHTFTPDTFHRIRQDYVVPKLLHEQRRLDTMRSDAEGTPSVLERRQIEAQELFVGDIRSFEEEIACVTPLWNPDLDDGVLINFAPFWRLVPQYKSWQNELKATWEDICQGKYDWSHLSMRLWPERVVKKCFADRSLAIAHGLENELWVENDNGKWEALSTPSRPMQTLIDERTVPAVKDALQKLLNDPNASAPHRARRPKAV